MGARWTSEGTYYVLRCLEGKRNCKEHNNDNNKTVIIRFLLWAKRLLHSSASAHPETSSAPAAVVGAPSHTAAVSS